VPAVPVARVVPAVPVARVVPAVPVVPAQMPLLPTTKS